jgi:SPP1 gp7 family putative phage head morphogenesis protein
MAANEETTQLLAQLRSYLARLTDDHTRTVVAAWARAWDDIAPELTATIAELTADGPPTRMQIIRSRRLANSLAVIEQRLTGLVDQSAAKAIGNLRQVIDNAGRTTDRLISSQLPTGEQVAGWSRVDASQVDAMVQRSTEQITKLSYPLADHATAVMKRQLVRGILVGANPREVARRMVRQAEVGFNGGLTRALTIARTEMLDAHRAASMLAEKQHTDVLAGWIWVAELGHRTCPACWAMNGQEFPLTEPGPSGHQNCRCVRVPKTKSWRELGFKNVEEQPSLLQSSATMFGRLSTSEQLDVLGPARYAAWRAGKFPMSKWATLRHASGWRDSWVPSPAPAGFRLARRDKVAPKTPKPWRFGSGTKKAVGPVPERILKSIQALHDVPLLKNPLAVLPLANAGGVQGTFAAKTMTLRVNPNALGKGLTTAHEFGHYLDWQDFGSAQRMASATSTEPEWVALRAAIDRTPEVKGLRAVAADTRSSAEIRAHADYLASREELFARAYAQWVARKTGRGDLAQDLKTMRRLDGINALRQWSDDNFDDIADAFDVLFESRLKP